MRDCTSETTEVWEDSEEAAEEKSNKNYPYLFFKRLFDFAFSLLVSVVLLIPMAVIAMIIVIKEPGNPFYMQERVGKDYKELRILKFRTMRKGADNLEETLTPEQIEKYRSEYKLEDDPRLIGWKEPGDGERCFGGRLRQFSIDELPQIVWNVLIKGDMSMVGPRPILREELGKNYTLEEQEELLSVKPGLTGYWQAYARNEAKYEDGERQRMELWYVANRSVWLDIKILFATVSAVIKRNGI